MEQLLVFVMLEQEVGEVDGDLGAVLQLGAVVLVLNGHALDVDRVDDGHGLLLDCDGLLEGDLLDDLAAVVELGLGVLVVRSDLVNALVIFEGDLMLAECHVSGGSPADMTKSRSKFENKDRVKTDL